MKKFKCNDCGAKCRVTETNGEVSPSYCLFDKEEVDWQEVEEDSEEYGEENEHTSVKSEQLPDWCRVGEWVYDASLREYLYVREEDYDWYVDPIASGRIKQARKRPFNEAEMKALVGKVIDLGNERIGLISGYRRQYIDGHYYPAVIIAVNYGEELNNEHLAVQSYTIDGKPCYKFEYRNKIGEWVE